MEFWLFLPEHFKRDVIKKLDYKSRCRLRKCSKLDQELVDSCSVIIDHVSFEPRLGNQVFMSIQEKHGLYDRCGAVKEILQDFLFIFKHPKSRVLKLSIAHFNFQRQPEAVNDFIYALFSKTEAMCSSIYKLKVQKLAFHWGEMKETTLFELIKKLDPKMFKSLFMRKFPIKSPNMIMELVESEQWKNLNEIRLEEKLMIPLKKFNAVNVLNVWFHSLTANDVWNYIQKFQSTPAPLHSFFKINVSRELPLTGILNLFDVPVKDEPLDTKQRIDFPLFTGCQSIKFAAMLQLLRNITPDFKHTQRFQLSWSKDFILVVKIGLRTIKGTICRKGYEICDFDVLEYELSKEIV